MKQIRLPITKPMYGTFESAPARFTSYEAWVLFDDEWCQLGAHEVLFGAKVWFGGRLLTRERFATIWGALPPLPAHAFPPGATA